jgi:carboxylesterase type B
VRTTHTAHTSTIFIFHFNSGCGSATDTMSCLRAAPTDSLALGGSATLANLTSALFPFGPIFDGSFITSRPVEAFQTGKFIHVPVFFG